MTIPILDLRSRISDL